MSLAAISVCIYIVAAIWSLQIIFGDETNI